MFQTESNKIKGVLGLCRRAGALCAGHDAAVESIVKNRARLVIVTSDASPGLKDEIRHAASFGGKNIPVALPPVTMDDMNSAVGKRVAVVSVTDDNFAARLRELFGEEFNIW